MQTPTVNRRDPLVMGLEQQFRAEAGITEDYVAVAHKQRHRISKTHRIYDAGCMGCQHASEISILRQKYGLMAPQLTEHEQQTIARQAQA